jgi:Zn ribbon nucleic-acid-binding protein
MHRLMSRKAFLAKLDLSVTCPHCQAKLEPAEQNRIDHNGTMRCHYCAKEFDEGKAKRGTISTE